MPGTSRQRYVAGFAAALALLGVFLHLSLPSLAAQAQQRTTQSANPFAGKRLYVDPNSNARRQAETWRRSRPADAELMSRIASQPVARWLGGWVGNIQREVNQAVKTITDTGALPVFVAYDIPSRDCGSYSAGGAENGSAYRRWIRDLVLRFIITVTHRGRRGARLARRDDREYREYLREEQRRQPGCIAGRMPP